MRIRSVATLLAPRRFRMYGVGNGKSGTTTLAAMLGAYRARHECEWARIRDLSARVMAGELALDSREVRWMFRRRSVRYNIEADVAGNLSAFVAPLHDLYPDAQFVLLVRDCFSWLDSRIEHSLRFPVDDQSPFHATRFVRYDDVDHPVEETLREAGFRPIANYLRAWAEINAEVLDAAPADRLLVLRTEDLDGCATRLGGFLGVEPSTIRPVHTNHSTARCEMLASVPRSYVVERAEEICAPQMERFWGTGWKRLADRLPG